MEVAFYLVAAGLGELEDCAVDSVLLGGLVVGGLEVLVEHELTAIQL